jgi:hypothetical protein
MGRIRLACTECDREDFDGVDEIPSAWCDVHEVQSVARSTQTTRKPVPSHGTRTWAFARRAVLLK